MSVTGTGSRPLTPEPTTGAAAAGTAAAPAAAATVSSPSAAPRDAALAKAFPNGLAADLSPFARGTQVVAVQYGLGRLGFLGSLADGSFGPKTTAAVKAFQQSAGLPASGVVNAATLAALDRAVSAQDPRVPAVKSGNPIGYLSSWNSLPLSKLEIASRPVKWGSADVQAAYGKFVGEYWAVLKQNRVEADCKTLALFFMDQFRSKVKADTGQTLALPGGIPQGPWTAATADKTAGFFSRFSALRTIRPGYSAAEAIQRLDPKQSMIEGVNVRRAGVDANIVGNAAKTVVPWDPRLDNRGDQRKPEVPVQSLKPGDIVFIDHTGDGKWDHTVNIVGVERDAAGKPKRLTLAVGSFDDMKDADGATAPNGLGEVNNYAEEVTVDLDASGRITGSKVTWASEPAYLVDPRYSARTTLMELKPGGKLKVARWG